ncbi:MAG: hypothetical protein BZ135_03785 [Methanosphaera sp. rholeuAM6]|nr:MAG: hypothetical protein BZ135_03785 [Methanosphaera sp. rholeuAM6]
MNNSLNKNYYLLVPVVLALILVLIITLSNSYPLSWDIYTHINYALSYMHDGITSVDYLLNAPEGKIIGYPPLFHVLLIIFSYISGGSLLASARVIQVVLTVCNVFTVCYVAKEFFDEKVGFFAGILLISSFMFTRFLLPIPETLAMIFFTLSVYFYYKASSEANFRYSLLVAFLSLLTLATHFSSFVYLMLLLVVLTIVQTVLLKNFDAVEYYAYVIIPIFFIGIVMLVFLFVISPSFLGQLLKGLFSLISNPFDLFMGQVAMGLERYIRCIGLIPLLFAVIGLYYSFRNKEFLFVASWSLIAFLITNLHWFGVPVYTFRLLLYLIVPLVMLGGYAIPVLLDSFNVSKKHTKIFIIALIILSFGLGIVHLSDSSVTNYSVVTEQSTYQIAPPTLEEQEIISFFENETTGNKSVLTNNLFFGTVISSIDDMPLHYGFDIYTNKSLTKSNSNSLKEEKIGYILYDKSLIVNNTSEYNNLDVIYVNGSYYPSYYFTKEITDNNFNNIKLSSSEIVFENDRFILCRVI